MGRRLGCDASSGRLGTSLAGKPCTSPQGWPLPAAATRRRTEAGEGAEEERLADAAGPGHKEGLPAGQREAEVLQDGAPAHAAAQAAHGELQKEGGEASGAWAARVHTLAAGGGGGRHVLIRRGCWRSRLRPCTPSALGQTWAPGEATPPWTGESVPGFALPAGLGAPETGALLRSTGRTAMSTRGRPRRWRSKGPIDLLQGQAALERPGSPSACK